jgi:hypothetical protein
MNALKHGLDAETLILPGEDDAAFRSRLDAWKADFPPRDPVEEALVEQAARFAWQLDRADRAQAAYLAGRIALDQTDEARQRAEAAAEVDRIGRQLIAGPGVTVCAIPELDQMLSGKRLAAPIHPDDPAHPERLLHRLESTTAGCRWLLERWVELWVALQGDGDARWQPDERLRAVHLLGKQPVDAVDDPMVQRIYLCSFVLDSNRPEVFADQADVMTTREFKYFLQRLAGRRVSESVPTDREAAREGLLELVEGVIAGLDARAAEHAARAEREAALAPGRLAFDDDPEGQRLRRLQQRLLGSLLRTVDLLWKLRRRPDAAVLRPEPTGNVATSPGEHMACEKIRNEPNAAGRPDPIHEPQRHRDTENDPELGQQSPDENRSDSSRCLGVPVVPHRDPARILDATPEAPTTCKEIRNEPNGGRPDPIHEPQRHRDTEKDPEVGQESSDRNRSDSSLCLCASVVPNGDRPDPAGRGPPSPIARSPRSRGILLGPMSGLALTFVGG